MKKAIFLGIAFALFLVPVAAYAAGTASTSVITAEGISCTLNYTDTGGSSKATVSAEANIETTVVAEYGLNAFAALPDQNTTPTQPVTYAYAFTNEGNASDTYEVSVKVVYLGPGGFNGAGWTVEVTANGTSVLKDISSGTHTYTYITAESEDGSLLYTVKVSPSTDQLLSPNGASCEVTFSATTERTPAGQYTGANGNGYGGASSTSDDTITYINTSVMALTKIATVDSPTGGGFSGDPHAAVPGAVITYTIFATNEGSATAESVIIVDKVPTLYTQGCHIGINGALPNGKATITAGSPAATNWNAYYTTTGTPPFTYGSGNGTTWIATDEGKTIDANSTYVKWEKATVEATTGGTFTWGVMIK